MYPLEIRIEKCFPGSYLDDKKGVYQWQYLKVIGDGIEFYILSIYLSSLTLKLVLSYRIFLVLSYLVLSCLVYLSSYLSI